VLVGSNVFNLCGSSMPLIPCLSRSFTGFSSSPVSAMPHSTMSNSESSTKPFVLKMKTNPIRVCQSCQKDYNGPNDTMGLLIARAERRLVSNLLTGSEFLGRLTIIYTWSALSSSAFIFWRSVSDTRWSEGKAHCLPKGLPDHLHSSTQAVTLN